MPDPPASSDLTTMVEVLTRAGYVHKDVDAVQFTSNTNCYSLEHHPVAQPITRFPQAYTWELTMPEGIGYHGFIAVFYFDADGALITHGCWE